MISRYLFVCLYFFSFFLVNRWYDFYTYYFHFSTHRFVSIDKLSIKQLQYLVNVRGITFVHINEKNELRKLIEQTGPVREDEFEEPIEDTTKRHTMTFASYRQMIDTIDDCKETIWFVHLSPDQKYRQSSIQLSNEQWFKIERRLTTYQIQTGSFNCSNRDYSNTCRTLKNERLILFVPSSNHRTHWIYSFDLYSMKHFDFQHIFHWLSQTLKNHVDKDRMTIKENRSTIEFRIPTNSITSLLPLHFYTLFYRYGSMIDFHSTNVDDDQSFQIRFSFRNSSSNIYIFNDPKNFFNRHELNSFRSLNFFLSCLTINSHTLISFYFIILNIYFFYDIYLVQSWSWIKKILMINFISAFFWSMSFIYISTDQLDEILQTMAFYFVDFSQYSTFFMCLRNDLYTYSIMSKWIFYPLMCSLHIGIGFCFRWYLKEKFGRMTNAIPNEAIMIDQTHELCSKIWQFLLCLLFSDQRTREPTDNSLLQYYSPDSLWLDPHLLLIPHSTLNRSERRQIDFERLPIWRFTIRRRQTSHGTSEYYSDIELEQSIPRNDEHCSTKKSFVHRRLTNLMSIPTQDNSYTSESDENNNSLQTTVEQLNSSKIYQCSICLEKYLNHVYICTLPCLHHFHWKCLFNWLSNSEHHTCPLCRSPVMN